MEGKPNILLICVDQERSWLDLPKDLPLPAHEYLLEHGIGFENYHVNTAPCGPSRSVMYTGQHTQQTGVYANPNVRPLPELNPSMPTLGHMLRHFGYYTAYKGKWHLSYLTDSQADLEPYGFADFDFDRDRVGLTREGFMQDGAIADEAIKMLHNFSNGHTDGKPWFLAVNFINPHDIMWFDATGRQSDTRRLKNFVAPLLGEPDDPIYAKEWGFPLPASFYQDDLSKKPSAHSAILAGMSAFYGHMPLADEESWMRYQNYYFNCIRDADRHTQYVLEALKSTGLDDQTIVIFTSDHGERAGAHRMRQKAGTMYKEEMKVPLIVQHPDLKGNKQTQSLGSSVDLAPTILGLAGLQKDEFMSAFPDLKGHDLSGVVNNPNDKSIRDEIGILFNYAVCYGWKYPDVEPGTEVSEWESDNNLSRRRLFRGVHDGRYKFARYFAPAEHHIPTDWNTLLRYNDVELYDTFNDPDELINLAAAAADHQGDILRLNNMTNNLIAQEIGIDNGSEYPESTDMYNQLQI
jgi:arylsulfatase A-like enzyme